MKNGWSGRSYSVFRVLFGSYLAFHYFQLVPWGPELFSNRGVLPDASFSPLAHLYPNVLALWDSPSFVQCLLVVAALAAIFLAIGLWDRAAAVVLWYLGACFLGRNPLIANPALPYVGWLLLAHALLPPAPDGSLAARIRGKPNENWQMPPSIFLAAWVVMAVGYTYSGVIKLSSPSWLDGTALARILSNPLARSGFVRLWLLGLPSPLMKIATWSALGLELSFAPLAIFRGFRPWIWSAMLCLHVGLFVLIAFPDLTAGMVFLHMFTFDPAWLAELSWTRHRLAPQE
jgi:hypothetical protein